MKAPLSIANAARKRIAEAAIDIKHSLREIAAGRPGNAEPDTNRRVAVLEARTGISHAEALRRAKKSGAEAIWGDSIDFVDVAFLERGAAAARSVCRIITSDGQGFGTAFLISPRLIITNNHVLGSAAAARRVMAEFDFERDVHGAPKSVTRFALDPNLAFFTNDQDNLDYTIIAVGPRISGSKTLPQFGYLALSSARNKHALGDHVNIVQHPDGRFKEAVVRENRLVGRPKSGTVLHYVADTEPGASGSPVFNVKWNVVALHHWGGPHRELFDDKGVPVPRSVNEGIRASAITLDLETRRASLTQQARGLVDEALSLHPESLDQDSRAPTPSTTAPSNSGLASTVAKDGSVTWNIPLSVTVRIGVSGAIAATDRPGSLSERPVIDAALPQGLAEGRIILDEDYGNRSGYDPEFIPGTVIPLPKLSKPQKKLAATNQEAKNGENPHELKYEHFSAVMHAKRRLAFFTATTIDGKRAKDVNRDTLAISDPVPSDDGDEELIGAEAVEQWFQDNRIEASEQTPSDFYSGQTTFDASGDPIKDRRTNDHRNRMFQQGHLTRRQDPLWGVDDVVLRAHADTFHVTNRAPQVGYFNMGTKKIGSEAKKHPGGTLHWRALEDYVLNNARADQQRVIVFTGPVFDDERDFPWSRGRDDMKAFKAPRQFWKVVVRRNDGALHATALLADQSPLIDHLPEMLELEGAEAARISFDKVAKYHVSIKELEHLTGLDFGQAVNAADTFGGNEGRRSLQSFNDFALAEVGARRGAVAKAKSRTSRKA
jgi:endonuclease G, mitochondrial